MSAARNVKFWVFQKAFATSRRAKGEMHILIFEGVLLWVYPHSANRVAG